MDLLGEWSLGLVRCLVRGGVGFAVVSPGSRSTPLVWALHQMHGSLPKPADGTAGLELVEAIDEREAAFFALGCARATGRLPMLLCTSGSAPAHYYPAVVEASEAFLPLLVVSADRPQSLIGSGANQTTDQRQLYGVHVRGFADLTHPSSEQEQVGTLSPDSSRLFALAEQVVRSTRLPLPGPAHLNVRFDKPLEPAEAESEETISLETVEREAPLRETPGAQVQELRDQLNRAARGLVVAGPWHPVLEGVRDADIERASHRFRKAVRSVCEAFGLLLCAESTSQLRHGTPAAPPFAYFDPVLFDDGLAERLSVDFILQLGGLPASRGFDRFLSRHPELERVVVHPYRPPDPWRSARSIQAGVTEVLEAVLNGADGTKRRGAFLEEAARLQGELEDIVRQLSSSPAGAAINEARALQLIVEAMPAEGTLVVGNSLPIRSIDRWVASSEKAFSVLCQRGVSGIDGLISGVLGASFGVKSRGQTGPVVLVLGDVSAAHGIAGLQLHSALDRFERGPTIVVILNNQGGRIFEQLPVCGLKAFSQSKLWTTPHQCAFRGAAELYGVRFALATTAGELQQSLATAMGAEEVTLLEVRVPSHDIANRDARLNEAASKLTMS